MDQNVETIENFEQLLKDKNLLNPLSIYDQQKSLKLRDDPSKSASLAKDIISSVAANVKAMQRSAIVKLDKNVRTNLEKHKKHVLLPLNLLEIEDTQPKPSTSKFETQCVTDTQLLEVINKAEALVGFETQNQITDEFETSFTNKLGQKEDTVYFDTSIDIESQMLVSELHEMNKVTSILERDKNNHIGNHEGYILDTNDDQNCESVADVLQNDELKKHIEETEITNEEINAKNKERLIDNNDSETQIEINLEDQITEVADRNDEDSQQEKIVKNDLEDIECLLSPILSIKSRRSISSPHLVYDLNLFEDFENLMLPFAENPNKSDDNLEQSQILGNVVKVQNDNNIAEIRNCDDNIDQLDPSPILGNLNPIILEEKEQRSPVLTRNFTHTNEEVIKVEDIVPKTSTADIASDFLQDEILFSSDEEDDYVHKDIQELPFTCVLETSFYTNQSDVLDKTMYIDFDRQTCTDSYVQATDNIEGIQLSVSDLVEMREKESAKVENVTKQKEKEEELPIEVKERDNSGDISIDYILNLNQNTNRIGIDYEKHISFGGFKTASNKVIELSETSRERIKQVFQDIDLSNDFLESETNVDRKCENFYENKFTEDKKSKENHVQELNDSKMEIDFNEIDRIENINMKEISETVPQFTGFTTASKKGIKISEKSLARTKKVFQDIDFSEKFETEEDIFKDIEVKGEVAGLMAASNKNINISAKSLAATKKIFQDIDDIPLQTELDKPSSSNENNQEISIMTEQPLKFVGFQTASKKKVQISKKALEHSKKVFQDIDFDNNQATSKIDENQSKYIGLHTMSNKDVEISKTENQDVFKEDNTINEPQTSVFKGFQTASKKPIVISENALKQTKDLFKDIDKENEIGKSEFKGFQTASKKPVLISKEAMAKTKNIYQDIDSIDGQFNGFQTANQKPVTISKDAFDKSKDIFKDMDTLCETEVPFKGFQTASNKAVRISNTALKKCKDIFKHIDFDNLTEEPSDITFKGKLDEIEVENVNESQIIEDNNNKSKPFLGFSTANNKKVNITKESLEKSRNVFEDIIASPKFGFQTASKKKVQISKSALSRTKRIFQDFSDNFDIQNDDRDSKSKDVGFESPNNKNIKLEETKFNQLLIRKDDQSKDRIDELINTQVLNNFAEDLNTEDFKTPKKENPKRAGSPILSCPKAKRRKIFVTPYKTGEIKSVSDKNIPNLDAENKYIFDGSYKKHTFLKMVDIHNLEQQSNREIIIDDCLSSYYFDNVTDYTFIGKRNTIIDSKTSMDTIKKLFLDSVNKNIVPEGWFENHYKLILWKLIQYEIKYPKTMINVCNSKNIMEQLKYRYDKELYKVERPALRKIMEKDDLPSRSIVLSVASILVDGSSVASIKDLNSNVELILTDGWYTIITTIDKMLTKLVYDNKIVVGTKLITNGAELVNCDQGISPWEDTKNVRLKIHGNSTRRAKWDTKLGFHGNAAILVPLTAVKLDGGKISKLRLFVTRVYPLLYVEKFEDGSTVTRSEKLEQIHQMKYETDRQIMMEKIYEDVEKEFERESKETIEVGTKRKFVMETGSQIAKMLKHNKDPIEFRAQLTQTQAALLQEHTNKQRDKMLLELQKRVGNICRSVAGLSKIRVADVGRNGGFCGMLSVWRPNDAILEILKEGEFVDVLNVFPTAMRNSEIQLTASRQSVFSRTRTKLTDKTKLCSKTLLRICHDIKDLVKNPAQRTDFNEIDTVGIIISIEPSIEEFEHSSKSQNFQNVYLADGEKNIICLNFWGGIKKFGFQNIIDIGSIIYATNLQKRIGNTRKSIPQFRVTEFVWFTKTPKNTTARNKIEMLEKVWNKTNRKQFIQGCLEAKNQGNTSKYINENISPYRPNLSDYNLSKNKRFLESPLTKTEITLEGLDFESTFRQTDTQGLSPEQIARKKRLNEKMQKLKRYGEPPPLSPMHIINKTKNAGREYKSPLSVNKSDIDKQSDGRSKAVENKKTIAGSLISEKSDGSRERSLNRTYVKAVNPVKLKFSELNESGTDHFAEDFDGSPPLSLD